MEASTAEALKAALATRDALKLQEGVKVSTDARKCH